MRIAFVLICFSSVCFGQNSALFQTLDKNIRLDSAKLEYDLNDTDINWQQFALVQVWIGGAEWVQQNNVHLNLSMGSGAGSLIFDENPYSNPYGRTALLIVKKRASSAMFPVVVFPQNPLLELQP